MDDRQLGKEKFFWAVNLKGRHASFLIGTHTEMRGPSFLAFRINILEYLFARVNA